MPIELFDINKGYTLFSKGNYQTRKHSHFAIEIVLATAGLFKITTDVSEYANVRTVIIPSGLPHRFSCIDARCNLLFLDPVSDLGIYFLQQYNLASQKSVLINAPGLNQFGNKGEFDIPMLLDAAKTNRATKGDPRIDGCVKIISSPLNEHTLTVSQLAKASFLSESRLAHLFKEQLGISVHQCILWKKMLTAVLKSREGYSLTECAHYVGFSDSSHFNKVFYKMFGVKPFFVLKD